MVEKQLSSLLIYTIFGAIRWRTDITRITYFQSTLSLVFLHFNLVTSLQKFRNVVGRYPLAKYFDMLNGIIMIDTACLQNKLLLFIRNSVFSLQNIT